MSLQTEPTTTPASHLLDSAGHETELPSVPETGTVLVVEDDRDLAETYAIWLDREYDVRLAASAYEAREVMDADVDVALVDRRLPDGNGVDVATDVLSVQPSCHVGYITAVQPSVDLVDMPADAYVEKPVTERDIHSVVDELFARTCFDDADVREFFATTTKLDVLRERALPESVDAPAAEDPALVALRERHAEQRDAIAERLKQFVR
ncbi:response regulator [Halarchaeum sp. P4]|uniref:response regulator n=1 Tax=Halarchaeum sp. P4 TaxID=3421639 RepID=UPI003EBCC85C